MRGTCRGLQLTVCCGLGLQTVVEGGWRNKLAYAGLIDLQMPIVHTWNVSLGMWNYHTNYRCPSLPFLYRLLFLICQPPLTTTHTVVSHHSHTFDILRRCLMKASHMASGSLVVQPIANGLLVAAWQSPPSEYQVTRLPAGRSRGTARTCATRRRTSSGYTHSMRRSKRCRRTRAHRRSAI